MRAGGLVAQRMVWPGRLIVMVRVAGEFIEKDTAQWVFRVPGVMGLHPFVETWSRLAAQ